MAKQVLVSLREHIETFGRKEAALLGQIDYWLTKANGGQNTAVVFRKGAAWVALSRKELFDQVGMTIDQGRRAMERLKVSGVVVSEVHLVKNVTRAHIRIDFEALEKCLMEASGKAQMAPTGVGKDAKSGCGKNAKTGIGNSAKAYSYSKTYSIKDYASASGTCVENGGNTTANAGKKEEKENEELEKKNALYAKFSLTAQNGKPGGAQEKPGSITTENFHSVSELEAIFQAAWSGSQIGYCLPFTGKEKGQLKHFVGKLPEGSAGKVMDWCVRHWPEFVSWAMQNEGAFKPPQQPTTTFLLQYAQSAFNSWSAYEEHKAKPVKKSNWLPPQKSEPLQKMSSSPTPHLNPGDLGYDDGVIVTDIEQMKKNFGLDL